MPTSAVPTEQGPVAINWKASGRGPLADFAYLMWGTGSWNPRRPNQEQIDAAVNAYRRHVEQTDDELNRLEAVMYIQTLYLVCLPRASPRCPSRAATAPAQEPPPFAAPSRASPSNWHRSARPPSAAPPGPHHAPAPERKCAHRHATAATPITPQVVHLMTSSGRRHRSPPSANAVVRAI
jgi:hypothetical protein